MADTQSSHHEGATADRPEPSHPAGPVEETLVQGRSSGAPFVLLGGVALAIWATVAVVAGGLLLLWWLG